MEKKYEIIFLDEKTFSTVKTFKTYFKDLITEEIQKFSDDGTPYSFNELMQTIKEYMELLQDIRNLDNEELLMITYNPMGCYQYKIMKEIV